MHLKTYENNFVKGFSFENEHCSPPFNMYKSDLPFIYYH